MTKKFTILSLSRDRQGKISLETCVLLSMPGKTKCRTSLDIRKLKNASDKFRGKNDSQSEDCGLKILQIKYA